ncbi:prenylated rab acceptor PRA1 [Irpex lacteus]|nr:prenylated rab acceptor PRA1 [Irpex lacteus]
MEAALRVADTLKSFRETRLSALRSPTEFFDYHRISRPADLNQATSRISYNTRYFSGNYGVIVAGLGVYALLTNPLLLIAIGFLVGGFAAVNRFGADPLQVGEHVVTQKSLYTVLFVSVLLPAYLGHASLMEPGIESEYAQVSDAV